MEYARDIPRDQLLYRFELREQIGAGACRLAAKSMNGWQIEQLQALAQQVDEAVHRGDRKGGYLADVVFHKFLLENCGNPLFRDIWETQHLMPPTTRSSSLEELAAQIDGQGGPSMSDVANAIAAHDEGRAEEVMKNRVRKYTEALRTAMHRYPPDIS